MTPYMQKKSKLKIKNVKRATYIKYLLKCSGFSVSDIAKDLDISIQSVYRYFNGTMKSSRIENYLRQVFKDADSQIFDKNVLAEFEISYECN